ncbi:hypothetical protein ABT116_30705, partial [Streptomyces sp. NPDC002130]|uniref:hypothetical protein n=1 Tax=Streptomyces sp. NPDC002130 TaxID=3155568 RepID=UPI0033316324
VKLSAKSGARFAGSPVLPVRTRLKAKAGIRRFVEMDAVAPGRHQGVARRRCGDSAVMVSPGRTTRSGGLAQLRYPSIRAVAKRGNE